MISSLLKKLVSQLVSDYELYFIYSCRPRTLLADTTAEVFQLSNDPNELGNEWFKREAFYAGDGSIGFALDDNSFSKAAICWYWYGERYQRDSGFWPLKSRDALLMMIRTHESCYGQGMATRLIKATSSKVGAMGFDRLFARIWWSNHPSIQAFKRAGWSRIAFVVTVKLEGRRNRLRITLPLRFSFN
jgi:RimJ/RimL family protein N-acetyltransferase